MKEIVQLSLILSTIIVLYIYLFIYLFMYSYHNNRETWTWALNRANRATATCPGIFQQLSIIEARRRA